MRDLRSLVAGGRPQIIQERYMRALAAGLELARSQLEVRLERALAAA